MNRHLLLILALWWGHTAFAQGAPTPMPTPACPRGDQQFSILGGYASGYVYAHDGSWPPKTCTASQENTAVTNASLADGEVYEGISVYNTSVLKGAVVDTARYTASWFVTTANADDTGLTMEYANIEGDPTVSCRDYVPPPVGSNAATARLAPLITAGKLDLPLANVQQINSNGYTRFRSSLTSATRPQGTNELSWFENASHLIICARDPSPPVVTVTPVPTGGITITCPNGVAIGATCTVIAP